ncbi:hypothetical protein ACWDKQ_05840 [Saccharopolyspora sp. NPDC000995]
MSEDQQRAVSETFEVRLSGEHGGVMLAETDAGEFTFSTSATRSSLNNLAEVMLALAHGADVGCVLWATEGPSDRSVFLDFALDWQGTLAVAVHRLASWEWLQPTTMWTPRRADCVVEARVPFSQFVVNVTRELQLLRKEETDTAGYMANWGHYFPMSLFEQLERVSARHGYMASADPRQFRGNEN